MTQLRPCQPADFDTLFQIDRACFPARIAYSKSELRYFLRRSGSYCRIACDEADRTVGFCIGQWEMGNGSGMGHIITIDVLPEERKRGIGRLLMEDMERHFRERGATVMRLEVAVNNAPALSFYQKVGYELIGGIENYYPGPLDAFVMQKALDRISAGS